MAVCTTPSGDARTSVAVSVSLDGIRRSSSGPKFHYHDVLEIDVIDPPSGLYSGGTQVCLVAQGDGCAQYVSKLNAISKPLLS